MVAERNSPLDLRVPDSPQVRKRLEGFYREIGWTFQGDSSLEHGFQVRPRKAPDSLYYNYDRDLDLELARLFTMSGEGWKRSQFSQGVRLSRLTSRDTRLVVSGGAEAVSSIYERGGQVLLSHTVEPLTVAEGEVGFTYADPVNYAIKVTAALEQVA